jgi:alpha-ribazole phosphatase
MKQTTRIYLIRHGQTESNHNKIYQGRIDTELNEAGKIQAAATARHLAAQPLAAVYSSPLKRALATAEAVAEAHALPVRVAADLQEMDFGLWEGLSFEQIQSAFPQLAAQWLDTFYEVDLPEGESFTKLGQRVGVPFRSIVSDHQGQEVALIAHGGVNCVIICDCLGLPYSQLRTLWQDNGALSLLETDGCVWRLVLNNYLPNT